MAKRNEKPKRLSRVGLLLLTKLVDAPREGLCGAELMKLAHLPSGTLYPILLRFEADNILTSEWEAGDPNVLGRPRRRFYKLTPNGHAITRQMLHELIPARLRLAESEA